MNTTSHATAIYLSWKFIILYFWEFSWICEAILLRSSLKEQVFTILLRGVVFVVFSTSAFWAILRLPSVNAIAN